MKIIPWSFSSRIIIQSKLSFKKRFFSFDFRFQVEFKLKGQKMQQQEWIICQRWELFIEIWPPEIYWSLLLPIRAILSKLPVIFQLENRTWEYRFSTWKFNSIWKLNAGLLFDDISSISSFSQELSFSTWRCHSTWKILVWPVSRSKIVNITCHQMRWFL